MYAPPFDSQLAMFAADLDRTATVERISAHRELRPVEAHQDPVSHAEQVRTDLGMQAGGHQRAALGQFFTPTPIARLMASMFRMNGATDIRLLDPGAGVGALSAAFVKRAIASRTPPRSIHVTACEVDPEVTGFLRLTLKLCIEACADAGVEMHADVVTGDFIGYALDRVALGTDEPLFNAAILNPPYRKIPSGSNVRRQLRQLGIETSNIYTGFVAAVISILEVDGQLIAITPRSFCNGTYFKPFRSFLLNEVAMQRLHLFDSRADVFRDDKVLQENVIFAAVRSQARSRTVAISTSGGDCKVISKRAVSMSRVVDPGDPQQFIHIPAAREDDDVKGAISAFRSTLDDLGLSVSTGPVVDFRNKPHLRSDPTPTSAPLVYPGHINGHGVTWPRPNFRKSNAIDVDDTTRRWLVQSGCYVLVKRFSAKEERRRVVAAVISETDLPGSLWGIENHLNFFHDSGSGLDPLVARGLAMYLNSTMVDAFFRQFNGHTQVNAGDLRSLTYPTDRQLRELARCVGHDPDQVGIDEAVTGL